MVNCLFSTVNGGILSPRCRFPGSASVDFEVVTTALQQSSPQAQKPRPTTTVRNPILL